MAIDLYNMTAVGAQTVHDAFAGLARYVPHEHAAIHSKLVAITVHHTACGPNALACTGGSKIPAGWAVLAHPPETRSWIDVAVSIAHEARHLYIDRFGFLRIAPHECDDCSDPEERAADWIYEADAQVEQAFRDGFAWDSARQLRMRQRVAMGYTKRRFGASIHSAVYGG